MKPLLIAFLIASALVWPSVGLAQAPAPPIDKTPLARPQPLCSRAEQDAAKVMKDLVGLVPKEGFVVKQVNVSGGTLEAWKMDAPTSENSDRVLMWIERDLTMPTNLIHIYLTFGRYMKIVAAPCEICRVVVSDTEEQRRVGSLKQALANYCVS
jgi:hypothetical protein